MNFKAFEQVVILHLFHWVILPHHLFQKGCEKAMLIKGFIVLIPCIVNI